jgi:hypothetical protein
MKGLGVNCRRHKIEKGDIMKRLCLSKIVLFIYLILIVLSIDVFAGARDHDGGFFLRLSGGLGLAQTTLEGNLMSFSGFTSSTNMAIGGGLFNNFALHATLFGFLIPDPDFEVLGIPGTTTVDIMLSGVGVGVTYYLMPVNIYLSPSIGIGALSNEEGGGTDIGFALDVTLGKEWWVGGSWGLGVAGAFGFHSVPEHNSDVRWEGFDFALRFSATLN